MYNVLENFLANPCADTFEQIRHNSYLLVSVFRADENLAKKFFGFAEWFLVLKEQKLSEVENVVAKAYLKSSVSSFAEATKYFYSLGYDDRMAWSEELIRHAKTIKELQSLLGIVKREYRQKIVEKMREIATSDEEKRIAFSYVI